MIPGPDAATASGDDTSLDTGRPLSRHASGRLKRSAALHWPLILALVFAAGIGSWRIADRGVVFVDEGVQVLEARWINAKINYIAGHIPHGFSERYFVLHDGPGRPLSMGKPMHALINAIAIGVLPGSDVIAILVLQGLLGLGIIACAYAIAWRLSGRAAAAITAVVLACSSSFLAYRRSALAEMDSGFFFALAVLVLVILVQRRPLTLKRTIPVGVLGGLCFTANDRWYAALPVLALCAFALDPAQRSWQTLGRRLLPAVGILIGFALPVLFFEAASTAPIWIAHDARVQVPYETYFQQLHRRYLLVTQTRAAGPRLSEIIHSRYPGYLAAFDGRPWIIVAGAALAFLIVRMRREHAVPLIWAIGPLLLASASPLVEPRYMTLAIPGIALGVGMAGARAWREPARVARALTAVALSALVLSSLVHAPRIFRIRAGWTAALASIDGLQGKIISPKSYPLAATIGKDRVILGYQESLAWKWKQQADDARWLLLEVWIPPGVSLQDADKAGATTVIPPRYLGELSIPYLKHERPLYLSRSSPTGFIYEGYPALMDRVLVLYEL